MKRIIIFLFCNYFFIANVSWGATKEQEIASDGITIISSDTKKTHIQVTFKTHKVDIGKSTDTKPDSPMSNCTYSRYPCSLIDNIEVSVSGESLFVPRSVFVDLADLNMAGIGTEGKDFVLMLSGGDASESYIVTVTFDGDRVIRRTLASAMSPKKVLQKTLYYTSVLGD